MNMLGTKLALLLQPVAVEVTTSFNFTDVVLKSLAFNDGDFLMKQAG
jgi:hypothetical protein